MPKELDLRTFRWHNGYGRASYPYAVVRKDGIREERTLWLEGTPEGAIAEITDNSEDLTETQIQRIWDPYDGDSQLKIIGWRTPTEEEQVKIDRAFAKDKIDAAKSKTAQEESERKQYEKLRAKFEGDK